MKVLTVCQPWAWAIVHGPKTVENRHWATNYRGPLLIHAGKSRKFLRGGIDEIAGLHGIDVPVDELVYGAVVGIADLVDSLPAVRNVDGRAKRLMQNLWADHGTAHLVLARRRHVLTPVPLSGQLGLFDVPLTLSPAILVADSRLAKRACLWCGCTDEHGCFEGCAWAGPEICSVCAEAIGEGRGQHWG